MKTKGCLFNSGSGTAMDIRMQKNEGGYRIRDVHIGREEVKLSLFEDYMIQFLEISKNSTKKLLALINEFIKITEYKINT